MTELKYSEYNVRYEKYSKKNIVKKIQFIIVIWLNCDMLFNFSDD